MCKQLKPKAVYAIQQTRIVDPFVFDIVLFSAFKETDSDLFGVETYTFET